LVADVHLDAACAHEAEVDLPTKILICACDSDVPRASRRGCTTRSRKRRSRRGTTFAQLNL
jgi:hypothetical protein